MAAVLLIVACQESPTVPLVQRAPMLGEATGTTMAGSPQRPLKRIIDSLHVHPDSIRFTVHKAKRSFEVAAGGITLKSYPCVLGEHPVGDKRMQGDRRTPEGSFGFRGKRRHAQWHVFIWVDYPNAESRRRFDERKRIGDIPQDAAIGGEIGIHGVPDGMDHWIDAGVDWTWGCIALRNADVDEVYECVRVGVTTITINP